MDLFSHACPCCNCNEVNIHCRYTTQNHGTRIIYCCQECEVYFSESFATPIARLRTPLSRITQILKARSEGMGLNATARTFGVSKKSVIDWEWRLGGLKSTLMIYSLMHRFIDQVIEGDELYTKVARNTDASESEGWTIVLMERASRFLWELQCGRKDRRLFTQALTSLAEVIKHTDSLTLLTDGERRYGNLLFEICHEVVRNGQLGRPPKRLKLGLRVRLKNKGSKKCSGRKRSKYQAPVPEHPQTKHEVEESDIHANHVEAFNASMRRRNSAFRRKTNTYAKSQSNLQRTLDLFWLVHNFVRAHFTTKIVPAVKLGILEIGLSWQALFSIRYVL
jgi:transposase-like protein/IS1 family transposase